jgi:lambda repressor-like predicted transcriptional regulator
VTTVASPEPGRREAGGAGCRHDGDPGHLDESARRLSHEELAVAQLLVAEGHRVTALRVGGGRTADLDVCGVPTEVKSLQPGATSRTLSNALRRAAGQGEQVIVDARSSGLDHRWAKRGIEQFAACLRPGPPARRSADQVSAVPVIGDGYELFYSRAAMLRLAATRDHPRARGFGARRCPWVGARAGARPPGVGYSTDSRTRCCFSPVCR